MQCLSINSSLTTRVEGESVILFDPVQKYVHRVSIDAYNLINYATTHSYEEVLLLFNDEDINYVSEKIDVFFTSLLERKIIVSINK